MVYEVFECVLNIVLTWKSGFVFQWFSLGKRWKGNDPLWWSGMLNIMLTWKSGLVFQWFSLVKRWKGNDPSLWSRMLIMVLTMLT